MVWNRFVRFCEGMLGRSVSLEGVKERTKVSIVGEIISPSSVQSPISPVKAALIDWAVFGRRVYSGDQTVAGSNTHEVLSELVSGRLGSTLIVQTEHATVAVPLEKVSFSPHTPIDHNAQPLMRRPPPVISKSLDRVPARAHEGAELYYGERFLSKGDRISLRATVEPTGGPGGGPYRGAKADADFRVVEDERARIREIM